MQYSVQFSATAERDLTDILNYISNILKSPAIAVNIVEKILTKSETLAIFPKANPVKYIVNCSEYHSIHVGSYAIFYTVDDIACTVYIRRVIYAHRDIPDLLD